jgi:hypothetical protein
MEGRPRTSHDTISRVAPRGIASRITPMVHFVSSGIAKAPVPPPPPMIPLSFYMQADDAKPNN